MSRKANQTSFKKGVRYSISTEFKKGETPYMKGRKHKEQSNEKNRIAHLGKIPWNKGKTKDTDSRIKTPWLGKKRESISGENHPMFGKTHTEKVKEKIREKRVLQKIPNKETKIEILVEEELKRRGIVYQKQVPLCKYTIVDFYLPEYRIVIQCDGCYWHSCPEHNPNGKGNPEKETRQNAVLTFNGFNVYRFWEHDINTDVAKCLDQLKIII